MIYFTKRKGSFNHLVPPIDRNSSAVNTIILLKFLVFVSEIIWKPNLHYYDTSNLTYSVSKLKARNALQIRRVESELGNFTASYSARYSTLQYSIIVEHCELIVNGRVNFFTSLSTLATHQFPTAGVM